MFCAYSLGTRSVFHKYAMNLLLIHFVFRKFVLNLLFVSRFTMNLPFFSRIYHAITLYCGFSKNSLGVLRIHFEFTI